MKDTDISKSVREKVLQRDSIDGCPCCVSCGRPFLNGGAHLHHVKKRSQCGAGVEDNLVTLCFACHSAIHNGDKEIQEYCEAYLKSKYPAKRSKIVR